MKIRRARIENAPVIPFGIFGFLFRELIGCQIFFDHPTYCPFNICRFAATEGLGFKLGKQARVG